MFRKDLVRRAAAILREKDVRKPVSIPKQVFHISDDEGNTRDFIIKKTDKRVIYTAEDVEAVIDACLEAIKEALRDGDCVSIKSFGSLGLKYHKPKTLRHVGTGESVEVAGHYLPKFSFGNDLRVCAKVFEMKNTLTQQRVPSFADAAEDSDGD